MCVSFYTADKQTHFPSQQYRVGILLSTESFFTCFVINDYLTGLHKSTGGSSSATCTVTSSSRKRKSDEAGPSSAAKKQFEW